MLCAPCGGRRPKQDELIPDLEEVIKECAWEIVSPTRLTMLERMCDPRTILTLEVNWNFVEFEHKVEDPKIRETQRPMYREVCLFRTEFTNDSGSQQQYTFKTERQTKSCVELTVQKGYTIGKSLNLKIGLPSDSCNISGGLSEQQSWTKTHGERKEETLTWSVDSQVTVPPSQTSSASLMVTEESVTAQMKVRTTIRSLRHNKKFPVAVRRKKGGDLLQIAEITSKQISDAKKGFKKIADGILKVTSEVTCDATYAVKQYVTIKSSELVLKQLKVTKYEGEKDEAPTEKQDEETEDDDATRALKDQEDNDE